MPVRKSDKRRQIIKAAESFFTSRRLHEITLDEVAQQAGVGKGTIYRYFKNKEDLFLQTVTSGLDELCDLLKKRVPDEAPFDEQLLSACVAISGFFATRKQLFRLMQAEEERMQWCRGRARESWSEHRERLLAALAEIVALGAREGHLRSDVGPEVLAVFLLGMLRTRARSLDEAPEAIKRHELLLDLFMRGACAGRTPTDEVRA